MTRNLELTYNENSGGITLIVILVPTLLKTVEIDKILSGNRGHPG